MDSITLGERGFLLCVYSHCSETLNKYTYKQTKILRNHIRTAFITFQFSWVAAMSFQPYGLDTISGVFFN